MKKTLSNLIVAIALIGPAWPQAQRTRDISIFQPLPRELQPVIQGEDSILVTTNLKAAGSARVIPRMFSRLSSFRPNTEAPFQKPYQNRGAK